ncbi:cytochrome c3 family protein [Salipaludibacillus agaradhaerens]|uniref:cytochrome c3 family protein n=1 Tax=Salipaludibacillus agaradhaerens TaxID=76935 RepID=UPI0021508451|nr:NapC/NirT family cytochrome c [Salipaludibacillus agaradhaerens]
MRAFKELIVRKKLLLVLSGIFIGIVLFAGTVGSMKATDSPEFCSTCHIMDDYYDSFMDSNHATLSCNDCHAPNDSLTAKLVFKAKAGASHMYMNTLGSDQIPDNIHATAQSQEVIDKNCITCHEAGLENVAFHDVKEGGCVDCHRHVPHGNGGHKPEDWFDPGSYDARR